MDNFDTIKKIEKEKILEGIKKYKYISAPDVKTPKKIVAGICNSDLKGALINIIELETDTLIGGMKTLKYAFEAEKMEIYLPAECKTISQRILNQLEKEDIEINYGLIDRRDNDCNFIFHLDNVVKIYKMLLGEDVNYKYISVNGSKLIKVPYGTKIESLLSEWNKKIKFIKAGNKFYSRDVISNKVEDLVISDGSIEVIADSDCIVNNAAKMIDEFCMKSCGKCVFCREGLIQINMMMNEIVSGKGKLSYLPLMKEIGGAMKFSNYCSLGQEAAEPLLSSLEIAEEEYVKHIKNKKCTTGVCMSNKNIYIDPQICTGCGECVQSCEFDCIDGKEGYIHLLYDLDCSKCGKCVEACKLGAIKMTTGKVPKLPDRLVKAKMFR